MASRAFSYILFFSLHIYIIHAHFQESSANFSTQLRFLDELNGVRKGNQWEGVDKLKKYLTHLGYMITCPRNSINNDRKDTVDKCLELALKKFQKFYHLKITGVPDEATIKMMRNRRCGMPDFYPAKKNKTAFHEHYSFVQGYYTPIHSNNKISYAFQDVNEEYIPAMELALRKWESVTHFKFIRADDYSRATLRVSFQPKFTGDYAYFVAYTSIPSRKIHFNRGVNWSTTHAANAYDIESIFLHEVGHAFGLGHSEIKEASMYAEFNQGQVRELHQDDINGIRALYHL